VQWQAVKQAAKVLLRKQRASCPPVGKKQQQRHRHHQQHSDAAPERWSLGSAGRLPPFLSSLKRLPRCINSDTMAR
jgi:hypothetical protein